jgi:signal transduction histidine kinase
MSDFIRNMVFCYELIEEQIPTVLVYYSHIPIIFIGLFFPIYFLIKDRKNNLNSLFFAMMFLFSFWVTGDLITWRLLHNSPITMFAWSTLELTEVLFFFIAVNFSYYFFFNKNISNKINLLLFIPIIPVAYFTFTGQILENYDILVCEATESYSTIHNFVLYADLFYLFSIILIYIISVYRDKINRFKNSVFFSGLFLFLVLYLLALYISDYVENYNWSLFALAGMPIFFSVIAFSAVKFRSFNVKILGSQILVFVSIFMVATQFIFIRNHINYILNSLTLIVLIIGGILLVKSVKKLDTQKILLENSNREQETLIHFISHQVKGYFTKSRNIFSTLLDEKERMPRDLVSYLDEGLRSDKEGIKTVEDILNASNLKNGKMQYEKLRIDLIKIINEVIADNKIKLESKDLKLNFYHTGFDTLEIDADPARMKDVFNNLVQNAINYTLKGGINILVEKNNNKTRISIKDTGVGLSDDDKQKIFQSGGRGSEALKYNANSTGYGLFIAKKIVEAHNMYIWGESEGRDKGAKFVVEF